VDLVRRAVVSGEDLYALLGVSADASDDEIRHSYRSLARTHHPDASPGEAPADGFRRIVAAYEVLGDERRRAAYDRELRLGLIAREQVGRAGPVASHVAPGPTGAVSSRGRHASANPADHAPRVPARVTPPREPVDDWRLVSVLTRVVAAVAVLVVIAAVALMVVSAGASESEPPPPATIWCKTPDGWYDCWQATMPDGS
jgi:hypothetical protein